MKAVVVYKFVHKKTKQYFLRTYSISNRKRHNGLDREITCLRSFERLDDTLKNPLDWVMERTEVTLQESEIIKQQARDDELYLSKQTPLAKVVIVDGKQYSSISEASKATGLALRTIALRINRGSNKISTKIKRPTEFKDLYIFRHNVSNKIYLIRQNSDIPPTLHYVLKQPCVKAMGSLQNVEEWTITKVPYTHQKYSTMRKNLMEKGLLLNISKKDGAKRVKVGEVVYQNIIEASIALGITKTHLRTCYLASKKPLPNGDIVEYAD